MLIFLNNIWMECLRLTHFGGEGIHCFVSFKSQRDTTDTFPSNVYPEKQAYVMYSDSIVQLLKEFESNLGGGHA